jgi:hypothetical protein
MTDVLARKGNEKDAAKDKEDKEKEKDFKVFVAYNGVEKPVTANAQETIQVLLTRSVNEFHITNQPHILSLYNQAGVELPDGATLDEVGIRPKDHLLLRPSAVKGGADSLTGLDG